MNTTRAHQEVVDKADLLGLVVKFTRGGCRIYQPARFDDGSCILVAKTVDAWGLTVTAADAWLREFAVKAILSHAVGITDSPDMTLPQARKHANKILRLAQVLSPRGAKA